MNDNNTLLNEKNEGFTLVELLQIIKSHLILLISIIIGFVALAFLYTKLLVTPMYTSSVDILINIDEKGSSGTVSEQAKAAIAVQVAYNINEYIKFSEIVTPVVKSYYGVSDPATINKLVKQTQKNMETRKLGESSSVRITFEAVDPTEAQKLVVLLAEELIKRINLPRKDGETENIDSLKFATESLTLVNKPEVNPNQAPTSPSLTLNLMIGFFIGAVFGFLAVILIEQLSVHFKTKEEIEKILNIPVLAIIPARELERK